MRRIVRSDTTIPAVLLLIAFGAGALASPYFLDATYLLDRTTLYAEIGLMVVGMAFVIVSGEIDLSVASTLALSACVTARLTEIVATPLAILGGVFLGGVLGGLNGALVAYAKLPSFLVTLGTLALYRGAAQALVGSASVSFPEPFRGIDQVYLPYPVPVMLVLVLIVAAGLGLVLHRTVWGRWLFAVGANVNAALYSAIPVARVKLSVFVLSGLLAGMGGVLMDSRLGVARFDHARGAELDVITAVVLGGVSIYGGKGSMLGVVLAFLLIFIVRTGLGVANVATEYQMTIIGGLLVAAVSINLLAERSARKGTPE